MVKTIVLPPKGAPVLKRKINTQGTQRFINIPKEYFAIIDKADLMGKDVEIEIIIKEI